jgi:hypothetical protein
LAIQTEGGRSSLHPILTADSDFEQTFWMVKMGHKSLWTSSGHDCRT